MRKMNLIRWGVALASAGTMLAWGCGSGNWWTIAAYTGTAIAAWYTGYAVNAF